MAPSLWMAEWAVSVITTLYQGLPTPILATEVYYIIVYWAKWYRVMVIGICSHYEFGNTLAIIIEFECRRFYNHFVVKWPLYPTANWTVFGFDNGLSPIRYQAII